VGHWNTLSRSKNTGCYNLPPLTGISSRVSKSRVREKSSLTSLTRKKVRVLGVEKLLGLPCSFFFCVVTPLYLVHLHSLSPSLPFFMIQYPHWIFC
jgi:hypothetical protein